jgi:hypothetical protein
MLWSINSLKEISQRCLAFEPLTSEQAHWLGESLESFLALKCHTLDEAFGLKAAQGGVPWWLEQALRDRDQALRKLAAAFYPEHSVTAQARTIATLARRYAASTWRFDRDREAMPDHYRDTPRALLWQAFKSGAAMPISERRLRSLLAS